MLTDPEAQVHLAVKKGAAPDVPNLFRINIQVAVYPLCFVDAATVYPG